MKQISCVICVLAFSIVTCCISVTAASTAACTFINESFHVAANCTERITATDPLNVVIEMRGVVVPLNLIGAISNVTVIVRDVVRSVDDPSWATLEAMILVSGTQVSGVSLMLTNVTLLHTSLSLILVSNPASGVGLQRVAVSLTGCDISLFAAPLTRCLIGIVGTSQYHNVTIGIVRSRLAMQWEQYRDADDFALGLVYIGPMLEQPSSGLTLHVNDTNITLTVTTVPDAVFSEKTCTYFGVLVVNQPQRDRPVTLTAADVLFWKLRLHAADTPIAHMSMSVATIFSPLDTRALTTIGWNMRVVQSFLNMTGQDTAVVFMWTAATTEGAHIEVSSSDVNLYRRGLGSMTKLSCESSIVKGDGANFVSTDVLIRDVVGVAETGAGDPTNASVVDASAGSSASIVHLGRMSQVSVTVDRVVINISITFGYVSKKQQINVNAFCASALLLDSANLVLIFASNFTVTNSTITASSVLSYSSVFKAFPNAMMYLTNVGLFTVTVSMVSSRCVASDVTFVAAGIVSPILTATDTSFDITVAFAVTQTGLWSMGGKPSSNSSALDEASVSHNNHILMERVTFDHDVAAEDARWDAMPVASREVTMRRHEIGVLAFISNHTNNTMTLRSVYSRATRFMVHTLIVMGAQPLPSFLQTQPDIAEVLHVFSTGAQLFNSTLLVDSCVFVNGSLVALIYTQPLSVASQLPARLSVINSTFVSPALSLYEGGAVTRIFTAVAKPFPRLSAHITNSRFIGYEYVIHPLSVNWSNMALERFDDAFDFRCVALNGAPLTKQDSGVPSNRLLRVIGLPDECRLVVSATASLTNSRELPVPLAPRTQRADLVMSPYLTTATAVASLVSPLTAILMQRSIAALALAGCDADISDPPAASDSPLQLQLGNVTTGGYVRGAVVGNVVFLACACTLGVLVGLFATRGEQHALSAGAWLVHAARAVGLPGLALAPLSLLLQPTVTMSVLALGALDGDAAGVVLGLVGLAVYLAPCAYLGWMTTVRLQCHAIPAVPSRHHAAAPSASPAAFLHVAHLLVAERVKWVSRGRAARVYHVHFGGVFEGYVGHRTWFVWVEVGTGVAFGLLTGFQPSTDAGCRAQLWVNVALSAAILASVALWPYNGLLWNVNYAVNAAVMMVVAVLLVLNDDDASGVVAMVAAWVAVAFTICDQLLTLHYQGGLKGLVATWLGSAQQIVGQAPPPRTFFDNEATAQHRGVRRNARSAPLDVKRPRMHATIPSAIPSTAWLRSTTPQLRLETLVFLACRRTAEQHPAARHHQAKGKHPIVRSKSFQSIIP
jgi:hypothetical protein